MTRTSAKQACLTCHHFQLARFGLVYLYLTPSKSRPDSGFCSARAHKPQTGRSTPPPGPFYDPELYPDCTINLSTAENSLLSPRLIEVFLSSLAKCVFIQHYLQHLSRPITFHKQHLKYRYTLLKSTLPTVEDLLPEYINSHFNPRIQITSGYSLLTGRLR